MGTGVYDHFAYAGGRKGKFDRGTMRGTKCIYDRYRSGRVSEGREGENSLRRLI